jgi:hypothetical protein
VTKLTAMIVMNLVTPKAAAKRELMFNKPTSETKQLIPKLDLSSTTKYDFTQVIDCFIFAHI